MENLEWWTLTTLDEKVMVPASLQHVSETVDERFLVHRYHKQMFCRQSVYVWRFGSHTIYFFEILFILKLNDDDNVLSLSIMQLEWAYICGWKNTYTK